MLDRHVRRASENLGESDDLSVQIEQMRCQNRSRAAAFEQPPLLQLERLFHLTTLELDIVLIALAAEIDSRYELLFAHAQNDAAKKRPTVDLALKLLCASPRE